MAEETDQAVRVLELWADDASTDRGVRTLHFGLAWPARQVSPAAADTFPDYGTRVPALPTERLRSLARERASGRLVGMRWLAGFEVAPTAAESTGDEFRERRPRGRGRPEQSTTVQSSTSEIFPGAEEAPTSTASRSPCKVRLVAAPSPPGSSAAHQPTAHRRSTIDRAYRC